MLVLRAVAQLRAAVDAVRQPFSVNTLAQAAATEAIRHQDDVVDRVEKNIVEKVFVEEGLGELGFTTAESQANFADPSTFKNPAGAKKVQGEIDQITKKLKELEEEYFTREG